MTKPLASLSGLLLARKGEARPAMRPELNFPRPASEPEAPLPEVVRQQEILQAAYPVPEPLAPAGKSRTAFTLRLDRARHRKLRLAVAHQDRSAQQLVIEALDRFLETAVPAALLAAARDTDR